MYGGAARARRHGGGIVKFFHWEGEPQRELDTTTATSLRTLQLIIRIMASTYLQRRDPLLLMRYNSIYTVRHLYAAKPYLAGGRPKPLESTSTPLYLNPPSTF